MTDKRTIRGIRGPLPTQTIIGRLDGGDGPPSPISFRDLAARLLPFIIGGGGGGGSGITQLTGDVAAGPGSGSQVATLATVNSDVGSFTSANITVNAKGLITAAANGTGGGSSWIPAVTGSEPPVLLSDGAGNLILVAGP